MKPADMPSVDNANDDILTAPYVVWKFPLTENETRLQMPQGAKLLSVAVQNGVPTIWAMVRPGGCNEFRHVRIFGTGHDIPHDLHLTFIGTVLTFEGMFVWHVFEEHHP